MPTYTDGHYQQVEQFVVLVKTASRPGLVRLDLELDELVALHALTGALLNQAAEARQWPFGEYEKRQGGALIPT